MGVGNRLPVNGDRRETELDMRCFGYVLRPLNRFRSNEDGAATIEAVLWLPFFFMLFGALADVSMVFFNQSRLLRIVQDANRTMSIGRFTTTTETQDYVISRVQPLSKNVSAVTTVSADGIITTVATVPMDDLDLFGVAGIFRNGQMRVQADQLKEM
jgi:Flp pilus assembly protein TadG